MNNVLFSEILIFNNNSSIIQLNNCTLISIQKIIKVLLKHEFCSYSADRQINNMRIHLICYIYFILNYFQIYCVDTYFASC